MTYEYPEGMQLFAAPYSEETVEMAKQYIMDNGYNSDTVKLIKMAEQILVIKK